MSGLLRILVSLKLKVNLLIGIPVFIVTFVFLLFVIYDQSGFGGAFGIIIFLALLSVCGCILSVELSSRRKHQSKKKGIPLSTLITFILMLSFMITLVGIQLYNDPDENVEAGLSEIIIFFIIGIISTSILFTWAYFTGRKKHN